MVIDKNQSLANNGDIKSAAALLGSIRTEKKARASRENGKRGGRPKGSKTAKAKTKENGQ